MTPSPRATSKRQSCQLPATHSRFPAAVMGEMLIAAAVISVLSENCALRIAQASPPPDGALLPFAGGVGHLLPPVSYEFHDPDDVVLESPRLC